MHNRLATRAVLQTSWLPVLALLLAAVAAHAQTNAGRIAYASMVGPGEWSDVFLMDEDGGNVVNLTNSPGTYDTTPSWSPDGRQLSFISDRGGGGDISARFIQVDVYAMDADGGNVRQLTQMGACIDARWSPDGRRIAMTCREEGNYDVFVMEADGANVVNLSAHPGLDANPRWSPDGRYLAFVSNRNGADAIYRISADGWELSHMLALPGRAVIPGLSWSPDGTRLAFAYASMVYHAFAPDPSDDSMAKIHRRRSGRSGTAGQPAGAADQRPGLRAQRNRGGESRQAPDLRVLRLRRRGGVPPPRHPSP